MFMSPVLIHSRRPQTASPWLCRENNKGCDMDAGGSAKLSTQNVCFYHGNPPKVKPDLKSDSLFSYGVHEKNIVLINN